MSEGGGKKRLLQADASSDGSLQQAAAADAGSQQAAAAADVLLSQLLQSPSPPSLGTEQEFNKAALQFQAELAAAIADAGSQQQASAAAFADAGSQQQAAAAAFADAGSQQQGPPETLQIVLGKLLTLISPAQLQQSCCINAEQLAQLLKTPEKLLQLLPIAPPSDLAILKVWEDVVSIKACHYKQLNMVSSKFGVDVECIKAAINRARDWWAAYKYSDLQLDSNPADYEKQCARVFDSVLSRVFVHREGRRAKKNLSKENTKLNASAKRQKYVKHPEKLCTALKGIRKKIGAGLTGARLTIESGQQLNVNGQSDVPPDDSGLSRVNFERLIVAWEEFCIKYTLKDLTSIEQWREIAIDLDVSPKSCFDGMKSLKTWSSGTGRGLKHYLEVKFKEAEKNVIDKVYESKNPEVVQSLEIVKELEWLVEARLKDAGDGASGSGAAGDDSAVHVRLPETSDDLDDTTHE